jgi:ribonuclease HII
MKDKTKFGVIGVDEVGRGCGAGSVVVCACFFKDDYEKLEALFEKVPNLTDSKKLTTKKRLKILEDLNISVDDLKLKIVYSIEELNFVIVERDASYVDKVNVLEATMDAMREAIAHFSPSHLLIDGDKDPKAQCQLSTELIIKGDSKNKLIALASVIAKEYRDNQMQKMEYLYPGYGMAKHKGYLTKEHREALFKKGPTDIHRKTFIKKFLKEE